MPYFSEFRNNLLDIFNIETFIKDKNLSFITTNVLIKQYPLLKAFQINEILEKVLQNRCPYIIEFPAYSDNTTEGGSENKILTDSISMLDGIDFWGLLHYPGRYKMYFSSQKDMILFKMIFGREHL